jgi:hypothetical protein
MCLSFTDRSTAMAAKTVLDNEYATLWFYDDKKIVHHKVKKYIYGEKLQQLLMTGYETLKKNGANKWLSDDTNNGALTKEDETWAKTHWFPSVVKAGWKSWAIVLPVQIIGQMNMKRFVDDYAKAGITVSVFSDAAQAMTWLEKQ